MSRGRRAPRNRGVRPLAGHPRLRRLLPYLLAAAVVLALVLLAQPALLARAASRFQPIYAPAVAALSLLYYGLQGLRWHPLLRAAGIRLSWSRAVVLNLAGQAAGLLPGGELTRAVLVSEVSGKELADAVSTITVQELISTLVVIAVAAPAAATRPLAALGVGLALAGTLLALLVLAWGRAFEVVLRLVGRLPLLRRLAPELERLRDQTVRLLTRWDTLWWSALNVLQVAVTVTMFWLLLRGLGLGLGWPVAALIYAAAHLAGAVSLSPGGLGGFEAACVALLLGFGVPLDLAVAAALLQRLADKGLGTLFGVAAYAWARRAYHLEARRVVLGRVRDGGGSDRRASREA